MTATKPYRPRSAAEAIAFNVKYCLVCKTDYEQCGILFRSFFVDIDNRDYPKEWTHDKNGEPICTAHKER